MSETCYIKINIGYKIYKSLADERYDDLQRNGWDAMPFHFKNPDDLERLLFVYIWIIILDFILKCTLDLTL